MPTTLTCHPTAHPEVLLVAPQPYRDARGSFFESFNPQSFQACTGLRPQFVQDNEARSVKGVLRGLHYQVNQPQAKLVRVLRGRIWDVAVDLRRSSPRFGQWVAAELTEDNLHQLYVPEGFAHGYLVLSEVADVFYKVTALQSEPDERNLAWNDPDLSIAWPVAQDPIVSPRDAQAPRLAHAEHFA